MRCALLRIHSSYQCAWRGGTRHFWRGSKYQSASSLPSEQITTSRYIALEAPSAIRELVKVRDLIYLLNYTNRLVLKRGILARYGSSLADLLLLTYDPQVRFHVGVHSLEKYVRTQKELKVDVPPLEVDSVLLLLDQLASRHISGTAALEKAGNFLWQLEGKESAFRDPNMPLKLSLPETFLRLISRNLKAGINISTVRSVFPVPKHDSDVEMDTSLWPGHLVNAAESTNHQLISGQRRHTIQQAVFEERSGGEQRLLRDHHADSVRIRRRELLSHTMEDVKGEIGLTARVTEQGKHAGSWAVALGKGSTLKELQDIVQRASDEENEEAWYMSRKLDGVRCIIRVEFEIGGNLEEPLISIVRMDTLSRNRKPFTSLQVLKNELGLLLTRCPGIIALVRESVNQTTGVLPARTTLYLDGEICALVPASDGQDEYTEDFAEIVGAVRRKTETITNPAYFPFDILTAAEFENKPNRARFPFYIRKRRVEALTDFCYTMKSAVIRRLDQEHITRFEQVERAVVEAAQKGWEGLVLRKGDLYQGKRSSSIRKYKQWQEAEYTVLETQVAMMRLSIDQRYEERRALASVIIEHNRTKVSVGSGFTVDERLRFAKNPDLIIGKEITVQYFGESTSAGRANKEALSLRFPRVKSVWAEGKRDV